MINDTGLFQLHLGEIGMIRVYDQFLPVRVNEYIHVVEWDSAKQWLIIGGEHHRIYTTPTIFETHFNRANNIVFNNVTVCELPLTLFKYR